MNDAPAIPPGHVELPGSERQPSPDATLLGPADPDERFTVTIVLRRRPEGEPVPDFDYFLRTPPTQRGRLSSEDFTAKYGASPDDIDAVTGFVTSHGLTVDSVDAASRSIVASGTVAQMEQAFGVDLGTYERTVAQPGTAEPGTEQYRGRDGSIHVPESLVDIIVGVFGLDNRRIIRHAAADPPNTIAHTTQTYAQLYNFPTNSAAGQTIGIVSEFGYLPADISASFGGAPPTVTDVNVDAVNQGGSAVNPGLTLQSETTQDIVIAAQAAPGAAIAVYFTVYTQQGWVDLIQRVAHPQPGDPVCSVLSSSFYVADGDDAPALAAQGVTAAWLNATTAAFQDAAIQGVTVCIASADYGSRANNTDGKAHVSYPASDPWVLAVGGTTVGNVSGLSFDEYVWNDPSPGDPTFWGATGGGVSAFFPLPSYQARANVPKSINDGTTVGRGVPDVAGNASANAGYSGITLNGAATTGNGTSASTPLWAGLIAVLNAALGVNLGFVNSALYAIGSRGFNDITPGNGPTDNGTGGVPGYPAGPGWDACTGWGSPNGTKLLQELHPFYKSPAATGALGTTGSLLIPSAVGLLTHKRLVDVVEALERKVGGGVYDAGPRDISLASIDVGTVAVNDTERRVLGLAKAAAEMFQAGPPIDLPDGLPVGHGFGRFAVAGSAAFELPAYAELFTRNGSWVADIIRRGTPDENFSKVVVGSTQLAVRAGEIGVGLATDDAAQARIQSFSMGMMSALASQVVVNPVFRGLQIRETKRDWSRSAPAVDIASAEQRIVRHLLGGRSGAASWQGWWPSTSDVPDALFDGYVQAVEEAYGITAHRPRGFADYEQQFAASVPPPLTKDRLRDGYTLARLDAQFTSWGAGTWYLALLPMLVVPIAGYALVRALPHGQAFVNPAVHLDERGAWEVAMLGTGLGALAPAGYSIYLWTQVPENTEAFVEAIVMFGLRAALALGSIAADDAGAGVRWGLLFTPLALFDVYSLVRGLIERGNGGPAGFVFLLQTLPLMTGSVVLLWSLLSEAMISAGADKDVVYFVMLAALAAILLAAVGIPLAVALSNGGGLRSLLLGSRISITDSLEALTENGGPQALAALFDDSTLWFDPTVAPPGPTLADLRYPSGRRALLRIWWTGAGGLQISHDEHTVTFKKDDGSTKDVVLPPGKTAAPDLARLLVAQMPGLSAQPYDTAGSTFDLPYPHTLTDLGDTQATLALHDAHVHDFVPVGTTFDSAYILRHPPRDELVTSYGENGPSASQLEAIEVVPSQMLGDVEQSAIGTAADLAALLCMAAAPSLAGWAPGTNGNAPAEVGKVNAFDPPGRPALGALNPVFQVFRQWNLDERRVNEWRMLVQGGADRDQTDPVHADPAMRPNPAVGASAYVNAAQNAPPAPPAPSPEAVSRALGWVPLWRAWSRMATDITADTSATSPMSYTPTVRLADGTLLQPSNADLTNAMRFLLDLP